jgi:Glycosyl hydrolase family 63 C-terminal domain
MENRQPPSGTREHDRLAEATGRLEDGLHDANPWYQWGPYLSERAWGTVREDYSDDGDAWSYFPHDHARSRAYRWNEDGMAGISDIGHDFCLALTLWNGADPILKERMFGLTGPQGNHGEDVKDYWWYLQGLPSHALLQWRYHYPQAEFPYQDLIDENARRGRDDFEYELLDTGIFDDNRFWIVDVTYAKASATDLLMRIDVTNNGPDDQTIDVMPTGWFRNTWTADGNGDLPDLAMQDGAVVLEHHRLGGYRLQAALAGDGTQPQVLFCNNETNVPKIFGGEPITPYPKDGINDHVVSGAATVNPDERGTKVAWRYRLSVPAGQTVQLRLRLADAESALFEDGWAGAFFDQIMVDRQRDADEFYTALAPADIEPERMRVLTQASAGLIWSKQMYSYDVTRWLDGDPAQPSPPPGHRAGRNTGWRHVDANDILAMPDPWEYPWFAAWDLAFHAVPWAHLDPAFAKYQLVVLLREWFQHPNGALPAYEWSFDDINPPVHALAALRVFMIDGGKDVQFLERVFQKLLLNFTWWLNRQDPEGNNIFGGGFLGLDNISPVDRSHLPPGSTLEQSDGTGWMAYYSSAMLEIAQRLADFEPVYEDMVTKFLEQFALIGEALERSGLYDQQDGFFYDRYTDASGRSSAIKVKSLVGVIPALAAATVSIDDAGRAQRLRKRFQRRFRDVDQRNRRSWRIRSDESGNTTVLLSVLSVDQLRRLLGSVFAEDELLSPYGLRSLSKEYTVPYELPNEAGAIIDYEPAESRTAMYGGNSNWRGPVWFPVNYLAIRALVQYGLFFGDDTRIAFPTGTDTERTFFEIAHEMSERLIAIWLPDSDGRRPVYGGMEIFQTDPAWKDNLQFHEYFHGDNGAGLGATHQTGWTALVIDLLVNPPGASSD